MTGFVRNYNALQTVGDHELLIGRNRIRLDLDRSFSFGEAVLSNDVQQLYGNRIDSLSYRLREAYLDLYFENSDLRLGRQIITWGRADGSFITDILTPIDLSEFLTQDFSDLKMGVTALSYTRYFGSDYLQLVVNPFFRPNDVPEPNDRWFPRIFFNSGIPIAFQEYDLSFDLNDIQLAGRFAYRSDIDVELDLGILYWHFPNPSYAKALVPAPGGATALQLAETFTRSFILTYSGLVKLDDGLFLKSEAAFYSDRSFDYLSDGLRSIDFENPTPTEQAQLAAAFQQNSDGFLMERPWLTGMAGIEFSWEQWTISGQVIDELIFNHDDRILQERHFWYSTLLLQRSFARDKFSFRGFGRYNLSGNDFWINPELTYQRIDNFEAVAGTQLFGGDSPGRFYGHTSFDSYSRNSFVYLQLSLFF
ncbi:MAG: DUF1302 family protein [Balneolaceae bacterium]|nr:DUF1302 family protein [Balneolaceae bacterium]